MLNSANCCRAVRRRSAPSTNVPEWLWRPRRGLREAVSRDVKPALIREFRVMDQILRK